MELTLEYETEAFRAWTEAVIADMDERGAREWLRTVAFEFLRRVIAKMPVDTGRARAGWSAYLLANGRPIHSGPDPRAVADGIRSGWFDEDFNGKDQFIVLVNAVNYVVLLEFGSSRQAPAGMVRVTFRELAGHVTKDAMAQQLERTVAQANRTARARRRRSLP